MNPIGLIDRAKQNGATDEEIANLKENIKEMIRQSRRRIKVNLYTVVIKEGVINSTCYIRGAVMPATSEIGALIAFNNKYQSNLGLDDVSIAKI